MKNPMNKRILREFKHDLGKYLAIFLFMVLFIGMISGFLVTDGSFLHTYHQNFTEQKIEDGHFSFRTEAPAEVLDRISEEGNITVYPYYFFEEELKDTEKKLRIYSCERDLNLLSLMKGSLPVSEDEIAIDRMFAENNNINVGDTIHLKNEPLIVTGYIASPDYGCLYENNSDMMFDSINFSVAVMSQKGFDAFAREQIIYNYAWLFPKFIERNDTKTAKAMSDDLMDVFETVITEYNTKQQMHPENMLLLNDFLPRYLNQAINFVGEDMGGDKIIFLTFDYLLTIVLAFVFAITVSNTIVTEAGVIGTLRASGYTRGELLSHYMVLPLLVTVVAAVFGNVLGYTVFTRFFIDIYYQSYSLAPYEALWNAEAFVLTTVVPLLLMFVINLAVIAGKLRLSPLKFLRRDLSKNKHKKAVRLSTKIPFLERFRFRIILQNLPNYVTLFFGIFIGGILVVFGVMFGPLLDDYKEKIVSDRICDYQYVLSRPAETNDLQAEKYALTSLKTTDERFMEDEISVFGIAENSSFVSAPLTDGNILISNGIAAKFSLRIGDTLTLKDPYNEDKRYDFHIGDIYEYHSGLAVFMTHNDYCSKFDVPKNYFTGYFSNRKLTDIGDTNVAAIITVSDMTKASDQLTKSMGDMMGLFKWLGVIIFCLLMFIMSKQIIEKNATSISMSKILGFSNREIGGLYIAATSIVVVLSLLLTIPLLDAALKAVFESVLYKRMTGYVPFSVAPGCYVQMFLLGICSYAFIAVLQLIKINRIPKSNALKTVE